MGRWLAAGALPYPRSRRKPNYRLPALEVKLGYRPLTAAQQRELRAQWLAARVILNDFAERRCCSREIVINVYVNLDELISILCAAVAFSDDEHLWRLALPDGTVEGGQWARATTLKALALKPCQRFYCQYDFGDNWQFHGRLHQIPARVCPALWRTPGSPTRPPPSTPPGARRPTSTPTRSGGEPTQFDVVRRAAPSGPRAAQRSPARVTPASMV